MGAMNHHSMLWQPTLSHYWQENRWDRLSFINFARTRSDEGSNKSGSCRTTSVVLDAKNFAAGYQSKNWCVMFTSKPACESASRSLGVDIKKTLYNSVYYWMNDEIHRRTNKNNSLTSYFNRHQQKVRTPTQES